MSTKDVYKYEYTVFYEFHIAYRKQFWKYVCNAKSWLGYFYDLQMPMDYLWRYVYLYMYIQFPILVLMDGKRSMIASYNF